MNRTIIIGRPGSGKTTLSNKLGNMLNIPVYHLDKFVTNEKGVRISQEDFIKKQEEIMKESKWIIDGNWANTIVYRIKHADTIILFDFSVWLALFQYFKRVIINFNTVRPDSGGQIKTRFRWHAIKSIIRYPREQVNSILSQNRRNKKVYILNNRNDVSEFIKMIM